MLPIWAILLILFGVSLLISAIGFKKFVWFLSVGYGLSIFGCGIALAVIYGVEQRLNITGVIACALLVIYGFRLGGFLLFRELKAQSYQKTLKEVTKTEKPIPMFVKVTIWLVVAALYMCQAAGVAFVLELRDASTGFFGVSVLEIVGISIMALGIFLESLADHQKSASKKVNPHMPAMTGLYRLCRCPNYYGEILMWTGVYVFSFATILTIPNGGWWWMYLVTTIAYISIVYIMLNGAKRLEGRQAKNYGENPEFQAYIAKTPIIIVVCIPIKTLLKSKVIK